MSEETNAVETLRQSALQRGIPTATVVLKTEKVGNTVRIKGVTPAELMFLIADNHINAGGDPIVSLTPEMKKVKGEVPERDGAGQLILDSEEKPVMVPGYVDTDEPNVSKLNARQERDRLGRKYGIKRVQKLFPGPIPNLPMSFEEAKEVGLSLAAPGDRMIVSVGGE